MDSLTKRLEALENAAQQPTPASEAEPTPAPEEEPSTAVSTNVEQVVYDEGGLAVTYTGIGHDHGPTFNFFVENNTDQERYVDFLDLSVNDLMMSSGIATKVLARKAKNTSLSVSNRQLENNGIETIETVEFTLWIRDENNHDLYEGTVTITP